MSRTLPLDGQVFRGVKYIGQRVLWFGNPEYELHPFVNFTIRAGQEVNVNPFKPPYPAELFELVGGNLLSLSVEDGNATCALSDGRILEIKADLENDAWELVGPRGFRWVCGPGGELTTWTPS